LSINQQALGHFWSLAVEEQFYWIWPGVLRKLTVPVITGVAIACMPGALILRVVVNSHWFAFWNTFARMDALMAGALCALCLGRPKVQLWTARFASHLIALFVGLVAAVVIGDYVVGPRFTDTIGLSLLALAYGSLLLNAVHGPPSLRRVLRFPVLLILGRYSYGIYVYHQPLYYALRALNVTRGWPLLIATLAGSMGIAVISYELLEKRILQLKDRWAPTA
jgi:peptidoglycan/LPS O-acetylase OafA/YrhL